MSKAEYPVWLAIMPDQRDEARAAIGKHPDGGSAIKWSKEDKLWYARPGTELSRLEEWLPDRHIRVSGSGDPKEEFHDQMTQAGLVLNGLPEMDGKVHRVPVVEGKKGNRDGAYRGFLDGIKPAGWFINYHRANNTEDVTRWKASGGSGEADPVARVHIRAIMRQSQDDSAREQAETYARQTASAKALYNRLPTADPEHAYLTRKGISVASDVRETRNGALVIPFYDVNGEFRTLQYIPPEGDKYLFKHAPKTGNFRVEGGLLQNGKPILYAEGYATARSLHMVTGRPAVMAIDAGNMEAVARILKEHYPESPHLFMADVDHAKEKNKGVISATRAAAATGGVVLIPDLTAAEIARGFTDFNDLHQSRGTEALRTTLLPDITRALESLNYKESTMDTPDGLLATPDNTPVPASDIPEARPTSGSPSAEAESSRSRPGAAQEKLAEILKLRDEGIKPAQIAEQLGIGQTSVYRILRANKSEGPEEKAPASQTDKPALTEPETVQTSVSGPTNVATTEKSVVPGDEAVQANTLYASGSAGVDTPAELGAGSGEPYRPIPQGNAETLPGTASAPERGPDIKAEFDDIAQRMQTLLDESGTLSSDDLAGRLSKLMAEHKALTGIWMSADETEIPDSTCLALEKQLQERLEMIPDKPDMTNTTSEPSPAIPSGEENAILTGPRRITPSGDETPEAQGQKRIDTDRLLSRVTHETQPDGKSVLYKLDGEPAFIDRGNRLVMADGASTHEEKVLAALLTAAEHYHGRIELTGSDAFRAFAINVIVANKLDVSMKNASQQAALDDARRAAGQPVTPVDAIRGEPVVARDAQEPAAAHTTSPSSPVAAAAQHGTVHTAPSPSTTTSDNTSVTTSPVTGESPAPSRPAIPPAVHTPAEKAREPVTGKVTACGSAPFRFDPAESSSSFITLRNRDGTQTFWGKELAGLLRESRLKEGQMITLQWMGEQKVTVNKPIKDAQGEVIRYEKVDAKRNQWSLTPLRGTRVQTGDDQMVKFAAFDVNRYTQIQHMVVSRLGLDLPAPPRPADGLYWLRPDGQGSTSAGDALSADRPAQNERAGTPLMSAWAADGTPDVYLVQGDGHYLQGVVRQNGVYQHVLASLPDSKESPPIVVNLLTPEGAVPIGSGNGINRSNGQPVPREHVVLRLTGDEQPRIAKLDMPGDIPPALHARLGYDERYKSETPYSKDRPAAAPQAAPVTPPRPA